MRVSVLRVLILFAAVFAGLYIPYTLTEGRRKKEAYDHLVTKRMDQFIETINGMLAERDGACIYEGPFPFSTRERRGRSSCDRCEDLYQAGLVTKNVYPYEESGTEKLDAVFELTILGRTVYVEDIGRTGGKINGRFCFGQTVVHQIVETLPPVQMGSEALIGIKYVAKVIEPHPFLFDPRSEPLRLAVPARGEPHVLAPRTTTVAVRYDGTVEISHVRVGKFVNQ